MPTNLKSPPNGVMKFFLDSGFILQRMGGNTTAWVNSDSDTLGVEIIISDGSYHAPSSWVSRVSVQVNLLDRTGSPVASYLREFPTVVEFNEWYDSDAGAFCSTRTSDAEFTEEHLLAVGFVGID
jgi:hypothetical protein